MLAELRGAIRATGYEPPTNILVGKVTRFSTNGKRNDRSGWVHVFDDGQGATFGCWRSGEQHSWQEKRTYNLDVNEQEVMRQQFEESKRKAIAERNQAYVIAAKEANAIFENAVEVTQHDYLTKKGIRPNMARIFGGKLIIPVYDDKGNIQSLQSIFSDGNKRFHPGGKMLGGNVWLGNPSTSDMLLVAEGFATADSLQQATGYAVCVAFSAGNLKTVVEMISSQHLGKKIVVCADNDDSGVGLEKANACGVEVISPVIVGDFNDLMQQFGLDAVKEAFFGATKKEGLFVTIEEMMSTMEKPDWLLKGILERGSINLLFGESGAGKSLFAMEWAFCMANGIPWNGHAVPKEGLNGIIIMGEGLRGATLRFQALSQKYGKAPKRIMLSRKSVNLLNQGEADDIIRIVTELDFIPDYIIIDTLHRNMVGDENSSEDMALYFKSIELFAKKLKAAILTVHHNGHGDKGRSRGSSSIKAAMDAEFCVTKTGEGVKFSCTKSKDFGAGKDMMFTIKQVELEGEIFLDDDTGEQITSVYLKYQGDVPKETKLNKNSQKTFDTLIQALEIHGKEGYVLKSNGEAEIAIHYDTWRPFIKGIYGDQNESQYWKNAREDLVKQGLMGEQGKYYWVI